MSCKSRRFPAGFFPKSSLKLILKFYTILTEYFFQSKKYLRPCGIEPMRFALTEHFFQTKKHLRPCRIEPMLFRDRPLLNLLDRTLCFSITGTSLLPRGHPTAGH